MSSKPFSLRYRECREILDKFKTIAARGSVQDMFEAYLVAYMAHSGPADEALIAILLASAGHDMPDVREHLSMALRKAEHHPDPRVRESARLGASQGVVHRATAGSLDFEPDSPLWDLVAA